MKHFLVVWSTQTNIAPKHFREGVCYVIAHDEVRARELTHIRAQEELRQREQPEVPIVTYECREVGLHMMGQETEGVLESMIW